MNHSILDRGSVELPPTPASSTSHRSDGEQHAAVFHSPDAGGDARRGRTASRLGTLRAVASGLSHDLGNALMPIRPALESLAAGELSARALADLDSIRCSAEYLQNLANGLRMLSRDPFNPAPEGPTTELSRWWREFEALVRAMLKGRVAVADFATDHSMIVGLPRHRLTHAVFAVLQHLTAEERRSAQRVELWVDGLCEPRRARICASEKLPQGKDCAGPDLDSAPSLHRDLEWVRGIVGEAGGRLDVDARPGWGTTYALSLPLAEPAVETSVRRESRQSVALHLPRGRQGAYVRCVLESMQVQVVDPGKGLPADGLAMWITDDPEEALRVARQSNLRSPARVVFFGQPIADAPSNVISLGPQPDAPTVREALRNALRAQPHSGAAAP